MKLFLEMTADAIQKNPSIAGGICIFAVGFTLVTANAIYGQQGGHPGPIWATRDKMITQSLPANPIPRRQSTTIAPNTLSLEVVPVPVMRPKAAADRDIPATQNVVFQVQRDLAALAYYDDKLDGVYGPRTKQAILQFEEDFGYAQSGEASAALAERLAKARQKEKSAGQQTALSPRGAETVTAQRVSLQPVAPQPVSKVEIVSADDSLRDSAIIARIQIGLINFGEDQIVIDGVMGDDTKAAIRRFEKRYGLPQTGEPSASIIDKMEDIGVLQKS